MPDPPRLRIRRALFFLLGGLVVVTLAIGYARLGRPLERAATSPAPVVQGVPAFDAHTLDTDLDVATWWATHPYNPANPASLPVGGIHSPQPLINVQTEYNWNIQAAINAVPQSGGTLYLPAGIYATPAFLSIAGRGNIHLIGDPNGGTTIRQNLSIVGCPVATDCDYATYNQCVYQAASAHDTTAACWQTFTNTPTRNIYVKDITFDGGYTQRGPAGRCAADWTDSMAVELTATQDVLFDNVTFQNYCDPIQNNPQKDPATGLGACLGACHPGLVNFSAGNDNVWCRRCRFLGPGRYPWYADGTRGSGLLSSYFLFKPPGESDPRFEGGPIFLNNDDFTMDQNFDGTYQNSELRFPQLVVISDNAFVGYNPTHAIDYSGASALIQRNTVSDPEGRVIPRFLDYNTECSFLWNVSYGLSYHAFGSTVVDNHISTGVNTFLRADATRGSVARPGADCQVPGQIGRFTVRDNVVDVPAALNGTPFNFLDEIGSVAGPNVVDHNCVAGKDEASGAACTAAPGG